MHDVVVIGGGVVGLSIAYEVSRRGQSVVVLDQAQPGREASWAGAGMLPPAHPNSPLSELSSVSTALWRQWSEKLQAETGIDNGYHRCGGLQFADGPDESLDDIAAAWRDAGFEAEVLRGAEIRECEPELTCNERQAACRLPGLAQVRNPRHLKALVAACTAHGVEFRTGHPVTAIEEERGRAIAAVTPSGKTAGGQFVVASGAWTPQLLPECDVSIDVEPIRGQIVLLAAQESLFHHILEQGPRYLVPRPDGRVLVGSTQERAGFEKANTTSVVADLIAFATTLVPSLGSSRFEQAWSGLRPMAVRGTPYLGRLTPYENLFVAAGHFRDGLKLSPATAVVIADLLTGQRPFIPVDKFGFD